MDLAVIMPRDLSSYKKTYAMTWSDSTARLFFDRPSRQHGSKIPWQMYRGGAKCTPGVGAESLAACVVAVALLVVWHCYTAAAASRRLQKHMCECSVYCIVQISECFERAALPQTTPEERRRLLSFIVVGGGPTGVEVAAELHDTVAQDLIKVHCTHLC